MVKAGLGIVGLLIIVFSTVTTTFLDAYSAGVSSETIFPKFNGKWIAILVTIIGTFGAILYPMDDITDFLYLIGSVFAPMIAVQIADYFILKKDYSERRIDWKNMSIWLLGFLLYRLLMQIDTPIGNTLPDMLLTIVLSLVVNFFARRKKHDESI
jgi:purine-cytosine permease-like protein